MSQCVVHTAEIQIEALLWAVSCRNHFLSLELPAVITMQGNVHQHMDEKYVLVTEEEIKGDILTVKLSPESNMISAYLE